MALPVIPGVRAEIVYTESDGHEWTPVFKEKLDSKTRVAEELGADQADLPDCYGFWRTLLHNTLAGNASSVDVLLVAVRTSTAAGTERWKHWGILREEDGVIELRHPSDQDAQDAIRKDGGLHDVLESVWRLIGDVAREFSRAYITSLVISKSD